MLNSVLKGMKKAPLQVMLLSVGVDGFEPPTLCL